MKVLITTSGIGSRLGDLTKYTNKSLINIGDNYTIDLILKIYKYIDISEYIITIGYYGKFVKQYLTIAYPELNFTFIEIDKYKGNGSSLGYSLLKTKEYMKEPFFFHCCDCLVSEIPDFDKQNNHLFVYNSIDSTNYASVKTSNDKILTVNDKGEKKFNYVYIGLSYIKDYLTFFEILENLYKKNPENQNLSDIHVYMKMKDLNFKIIDNWYDTGNIKSYEKICKKVTKNYDVLIKINESLSFHENKVVKFFHDSKRNLRRLRRQKLLKNLTPRILSESENFHSMELIDSKPISKIYFNKLIYNLLTWGWDNLWKKTNKPNNFYETCYNFYYHKTVLRMKKCIEEKKCIDYKKINGIKIGKGLELIEKINFKELCETDSYLFHGDFILDNILMKDENFCLIDWREDFGGDLENGDIYYDLGKLRHNIYFNHENINNNLFSIKEIKDGVLVDMKCNYYLVNQIKDFDKFVEEKGLDLKRIKIITSLIWINMSPLHEYPLSNFLFNFGKYNLFNNIYV